MEVQAEAELTEVQITVLGPAGRAISSPITLTSRKSNQWVDSESYELPADALGPLTLRVEGRDSQGRAFVWFIDGNTDARDYAIEGTLNMAGWEQWIHPWFTGQGRASYYPLGHAVMSIGIAYDLLYHELSEKQRAIIRRGVMENGIFPTWQEYFEDNRIPNHTSNWISMAAGGSFIGLMAFYDELEQDGWKMDGEPWFSGLAEKFLAMSKATVLPDGSYGEGIGYQHITYSHAQELIAVLDHMFGVKGGLADVLFYDIGHLFWLYISLDRTHYALSMGDSNPRRNALDYWSWFARESDDPVMKWFYAQRPGMSWPALLWDDIDAHLQGAPPEEYYPDSRVFPDKGNVVFRTGWKNDDAVFVYRAGSFFNHTHFEQGNFRFFALGEELITESGWASYYNDPYFWSYFIQASGHNTVLIDDYPESQQAGDYNNEITSFVNYAIITDALVSNDFGFVVSELAPVYYADIESYIRRIWFADPGYAILDDRIVSAGTHHTYHLQLHPPDLGTLEINDNGKNALIRNGEAELRVQVLAPETPRLLAKQYPFANRHITHDAPLHPRGVLQVTHDEPLVEQSFRLVLAPYKEGAGMPDTITEIEGTHYRGVEFGFNDGRVDRIYYTEGEINDIFHTDARSAFVSFDAIGGLRALALEGATHFTYENRFSVTAETPVHTSLNLVDGGERIRMSGGMGEAGNTRASFTTNASGKLTLNAQEKGASQLAGSSSGRGQTTVNVILSGDPLEVDVLN